MKGMTERRHDTATTSTLETPVNLCKQLRWARGVLDYGFTVYAIKRLVPERQILRIADDIHAGQSYEVDIKISRHLVPCSTDIQVATTQGDQLLPARRAVPHR